MDKLTKIMNYIENKYKIPLLKKDVEEFTKDAVNKAVFDVYEQVANLREL